MVYEDYDFTHADLFCSYYPLYPPHKTVGIDSEQFMLYGMMPVPPHVLLLPSDLKVFTKVST